MGDLEPCVDVVVGTRFGDEAKAKVVAYLLDNSSLYKYSHVLRANGGANAGHTVYYNGKRFVLHQVPVGILFGIRSIIGSGCVVDPEKLFQEISSLNQQGIHTTGKLFVAKNAHIVTPQHKFEDQRDGGKIGTTGCGIGPAYRDKYARIGKRAEDIPELKPFLIDLYEEWFCTGRNVRILTEMSQGCDLDIDLGPYPYVTSSHCTSAGVFLNSLPPRAIRDVWGAAKMYDTYVGSLDFQPPDEIFKQIAEVGEEFGSTTGRLRKCNWLNLQGLIRAIRVNGITHVVFSKVDVLRKVGTWAVLSQGIVKQFETEKAMKLFLLDRMKRLGIPKERVFFSESKEGI